MYNNPLNDHNTIKEILINFKVYFITEIKFLDLNLFKNM
jgi:hypothetical protein